MDPSFSQAELDAFLVELADQLDRVREADKAVRMGLRSTCDFFGAERGCIAVLQGNGRQVSLPHVHPAGAVWTSESFEKYQSGRRPKLPPGLLIAPLHRKGRSWALFALETGNAEFDRNRLRALERISGLMSKALERLDFTAVVDVRARIDRKIMDQLRPKDVFYQILHGLRSLTGYDHSAALLIEKSGALEVVAEQIAWRKGKSRHIGHRLELSPAQWTILQKGEVFGVDRDGGTTWRGDIDADLADRLDYPVDGAKPGSYLYAPVVAGDALLGLLRVVSREPGAMTGYEANLVGRFLPHVAVAIRNSRRTQSLELAVIQRERQIAMANLARGVSHDINNAVGAMLPLVQQMRTDLREGRATNETLADDLEQLEASLLVCRRIFGGMLAFATSSRRNVGEGRVDRAIQGTLAILKDGLRRHEVSVDVDLPDEVPVVRGAQSDLEQLVLNLALNAREAMPSGGRLTIRAARDGERLRLVIEDTGEGIAPADLPHVSEPFFTTKPDGSGLGLSTCRAIVWNLRGQLDIDSTPGKGTRVVVHLPLVLEPAGV